MATQLAVLIIHGMGSPPPDFARAIVARLRERLGALDRRVEFEPCFWSPILQEQQDEVWQRLRASDQALRLQRARHWIVSALGDPAGYLSGYFQDGQPVYLKIHEALRASLERLAARLQNAAATPLVVLAHSLGSVIVSNYVWNEERDTGELTPSGPRTTTAADRLVHQGIGRTAFERMETLTTFVTYGSNIPLFLPPVRRIECIKLPRATLPASYQAVARWLNVYDPYDVLGYPLATLWDDAHGTTIDDVTVDAGPWPISKTPFSHTRYDESAALLELVDGEMRRVLAVSP